MSIGCNIFNNETLNKVYDLLDTVTPLKTDCGKLCDSKCCRGNNQDGMLLFPGEEKYFEKQDGFTVRFDKRYNSYYVTCSGKCCRKIRPLSCRIFPYFIYIKNTDETFKISVAPDIRTIGFCPLTDCKINAERNFLRTLRIVGKLLAGDNDIKNFIIRISEVLTDFGKF